MLTGAQIRKARSLLEWTPHQLAARAHVPEATVRRAEGRDDEPLITLEHERRIAEALQAAGLELSGDEPQRAQEKAPLGGTSEAF